MVKRVLKDCLPTIFALMMISFYCVIDGLFIGNYVGDVGLAAINIAWPLAALITAIGVGVGIGGSVLISYCRSGDDRNTDKTFCVCFTTLSLFSLLITVVLILNYEPLLDILGAKGETLIHAREYAIVIICGAVFQIMGAGIIPILRNYNLSFHAMLCMVSGTVVNIIVNYLLICVFELGIRGAAFGTITAQFVVSVIAIIILKRKANVRFGLKWDFSIVKKILKIAVTGFGISLAPSVVLIVTNWQCLSYGGDSAVACYCVIAYITFPIQSMLTGVGDGTQPLLSYYAGAKDTQSLNQVVKIARTMGVILSVFLTIVSIALAPFIPVWFGLSEAGAEHFTSGMIIYSVSFILVAMFKFNVCYLNACMKTTKAMVLTFGESFLITPVLLYLLPVFWDINGIWLSFPFAMIIMLALYYLWKD